MHRMYTAHGSLMRTIWRLMRLRDVYIPFCGPFSGRSDIIADARVSIWFQFNVHMDLQLTSNETTTTELDQTRPNCRGPCNFVWSRIRGNGRVLGELINRLKTFYISCSPHHFMLNLIQNELELSDISWRVRLENWTGWHECSCIA